MGDPKALEHPCAIRPEEHAVFRPDRMGKRTLFASERILVGLNAFEPGQEHALHAHEGMDKVRSRKHRTLKEAGDNRLSGTNYLWLMRSRFCTPSSWTTRHHTQRLAG